MRRAPGLAGTIMWLKALWPISSWSDCKSCSKKVPALTIPQARQLIAQALEVDTARPDPLALLRYHQERNRAAYRSHRKRTREGLRRPASRRKPEISL